MYFTKVDNLVGSANGGYIFDDERWMAHTRQNGLPTSLVPRAFRKVVSNVQAGTVRRIRWDTFRGKKDVLIDQLDFHVAKEEREKAPLKVRTRGVSGLDLGIETREDCEDDSVTAVRGIRSPKEGNRSFDSYSQERASSHYRA